MSCSEIASCPTCRKRAARPQNRPPPLNKESGVSISCSQRRSLVKNAAYALQKRESIAFCLLNTRPVQTLIPLLSVKDRSQSSLCPHLSAYQCPSYFLAGFDLKGGCFRVGGGTSAFASYVPHSSPDYNFLYLCRRPHRTCLAFHCAISIVITCSLKTLHSPPCKVRRKNIFH